MPTHYTGRVLICLLVFFVAEYFVFPPQSVFQLGQKPFRELLDVRPGIDMVGGVSLVYKIKPPDTKGPLGSGTGNLADQVMEALKKRVDPDGVRNLVWRPIGTDELEIQMPLSGQSSDAPQKRDEYTKSLAQLQATNIRQTDVLAAIDMPAGPERDQKLADLSQGDPNRLTLFKSLADMNEQLAVAEATASRVNAPAQQVQDAIKTLDQVGQKFDDAKNHVEDDNLNPRDVEAILDNAKKDPVKTDEQVKALKKRFEAFPLRTAALNDFLAKYAAFDAVRASLDDASELKSLLKGSGVLEFHIVAFDETDPKYKIMYERMKPGGKGPTPQAGDDTYRWFPVDRVEEVGANRTMEWNNTHYLLCMITPETSMTKAEPWALERAHLESNAMGVPCVGFEFDTNGGHLFGALTTRWQPKGSDSYAFAIILDNKVISAPRINQAINGGSGIIEGSFTSKELTYLIDTFNAGSLPAQLEDEPIMERRVGSALGLDNLKRGLTACGFGLIVVAVFLVSYYYVAGFVAFLAVLLNLVIILGVMCAFSATFTLPSIAGLVLSVGTAVDANVLIFERLREEQHRGLGLRMALRNSYNSAFSAIVDSNMTSLITSLFLYWFGSEEVKGFGLTLIIGIAASLFSALFFTKTVFGLLIDKFGVKHLGSIPLTFPKWDKLLKPNIDWMGLAKYFYAFSAVGITSGLILFVIYTRQGLMMDIEFAAGTSVEFELNSPMPVEDVRKLVKAADEKALPAPSVVSVGTDQLAYEVVTPGTDAAAVRNAVVQAIGKNLKTVLPSRFKGVDDVQVKAARDEAVPVVFPVPADLKLWPGGDAPTQAKDFTGGVAIHLTDLNPPLKPADIKQRIDSAETQTHDADKFSSLLVIAPVGDDVETTSATVLVSNPAAIYSPDRDADWQYQLAEPAWNLVRGAINHEATLRKVSSFNPSVAGDMRRDAGIALTLSILVIMAYIWVRFGNLKYGTATVIALLHDTVFTLAALGFAHLLADTFLGGPLQLEKFRINLTVVAGILTIMGYSMIDTIVVFDRIRENRGKYGHLSRMVINDAINQTLSRTLLTCGTTTITVAFMYFVGGAGIHGFTFVLLTGILVGTYSSVAIAAPILLWNAEAETRTATPPPPGPGPLRQPLPRPGTPPRPVTGAMR